MTTHRCRSHFVVLLRAKYRLHVNLMTIALLFLRKLLCQTATTSILRLRVAQEAQSNAIAFDVLWSSVIDTTVFQLAGTVVVI